MSADNWAVCPRCLHDAKTAFAATQRAVFESYGAVPVEEFDAARAALVEPEPDEFRTFREDYEFYGAEDGEIVASYGGMSCRSQLAA